MYLLLSLEHRPNDRDARDDVDAPLYYIMGRWAGGRRGQVGEAGRAVVGR